jgi:hypothetical protein
MLEIAMKIADYSLTLQVSHERSQKTSVKESLRIQVNFPSPDPPLESTQVSISFAALQKQASATATLDDALHSGTIDPKSQILILLIEKITGRKVQVFNASELMISGKTPVDGTMQASDLKAAQPNLPPKISYSSDYSKESSYTESEQTTMQASGTIFTSDGKEISFSLNLIMQHQYSQTSTTSLHIGDPVRKTDPLVINFNGTAAQLSDQRFAFDLNSNGKTEQINAPQSGSGFLALDKNEDGKIGNGNELFGPATGNGFRELAQYDDNHDGWIDETDPIFNHLKVWTKNAGNNDQLSSLTSIGIGAISLQSISTPFDIKNTSNQLLGSVLSSSVALNNNGSINSVQQIDLTV